MTPFAVETEGMELPEDLKRTVEFHGHLCPGILIGYRAAKAGLEALGGERAEDEELVAIVENDSCAVDAVQSLAGATFGKGNLFYRDHGKQVFTFALRPSGKAVRLALKAGALGDGSLSRDEKSRLLMTGKTEELFDVKMDTIELPEKARIKKSVVCASCGEPAMETRTREVAGKSLCMPCAERSLGKPS